MQRRRAYRRREAGAVGSAVPRTGAEITRGMTPGGFGIIVGAGRRPIDLFIDPTPLRRGELHEAAWTVIFAQDINVYYVFQKATFLS
jgi:hypothetical protein